MSISTTKIYIIDKENEGKSKALNVALKLAHYKYIVTLDGDTILDKKCLSNFHKLIGENTLGIGGNVVPCKYNKDLIGKLLYFYQKWEYFRNFFYSRIAFDYLNCVPIMSGAISMFNKEVLIKVGGYSNDTVGEDFDLTLKLQEYASTNDGEILYCKDAYAYTQVPFDIRSFFKQRLRWQIGMLEVLGLHKKLLNEFSLLSILLRLMDFYESTFSIVEIISFLFYKKISMKLLIIYLILSNIHLSYLKYKNKEIEECNLLLLSILQILIHIFYIYVRIVALIKNKILKQKSSWGRVKRDKI